MLLAGVFSHALAQEAEPDQQATTPVEESIDVAPTSPCDADARDRALIDRLHSRLYQLTCSSASWFDGLFGNRRFHEENRGTYGSIYAGPIWSQRDKFDKVLRFQAHLNLPNMEEKLHAFIGRVDRQEFVTESASELRALPLAFDRNLEDSMLLGLGYNEPLRRRGAFDAGAGVRLQFPLDPYVKGSYRYAVPVSNHDLVRVRETAFWQNTEGFGVTSRVDWDRVITDDHLLRWTGSGTLSEVTAGVQWFSTLTFYHLLSRKRALAYEIMAQGQTDGAVPTTDYGFTTTYRQTVFRNWLWIEARVGVDWPRDFSFERRRSNLNAALAFELRYGDQP